MRFYSVKTALGSRLAVKAEGHFVDLQRAYAHSLLHKGACASEEAARALARTLIPDDLRELIEMGCMGMTACEEAVAFAGEYKGDNEAGEVPWLLPEESVTIEAPLKTPRKFLCIGLNYKAHAAEANAPIPKEPVFFNKFATSIVGPTDPVLHQGDLTRELDYEVELGVVIGRQARNVPQEKAWDYVFGYTVVNDISARDLQHRDGQWIKGKALDTYAPLGPVVVTADELDGGNLVLRAKVNGELRQESNTSDLIFPIPELIAYLSRMITLEPGDLIITGTPSGVGAAMDPPRFLQPGDTVECEIEGIGLLQNRIVAAPKA